MDLIQSSATLALLALLSYFIIVNIDPSRKLKPLRSVGDIQEAEQKLIDEQKTTDEKNPEPPKKEPFASNSGMITNQIDLDSNKAIPATGITENELVQSKPDFNVQSPHARAVLSGHSGACLSETEKGGCNIDNTEIHSVFNKQAKGVLPSNHDIFDKPADFGSDVTNINQFYKNNPDIFEKSHINVPNVTEWSDQGKQLFNAIANSEQGPINAYNFEQSVLAK